MARSRRPIVIAGAIVSALAIGGFGLRLDEIIMKPSGRNTVAEMARLLTRESADASP